MRIIALSDLHGHLPLLEETDVVCIAGDITPDRYRQDAKGQIEWFHKVYLPWVEALPCQKVITVAGNHDYCFLDYKPEPTGKHIYLENNGVVIDGLGLLVKKRPEKRGNHLIFIYLQSLYL